MVRWGLINDEIGYLQFNAMWMIANYGINPEFELIDFYRPYGEQAETVKDEINREEEADGTNYILEKVLADLKQANSIVLDLRFNGGGKDGVAMNLLNHFILDDKVVASKKARYLDTFTPVQEISIKPAATVFTGKVFLLTSHQTASAAELAVLGTLSSSNLSRIGSTTEGIFSSTLDKSLPNGWEYELSNEVYLDTEGNNYEHIGIPPDHPLDYSEDKAVFFRQLETQLKEGKDSAIELAIKLHDGVRRLQGSGFRDQD